jgi:hypothetical protein
MALVFTVLYYEWEAATWVNTSTALGKQALSQIRQVREGYWQLILKPL